MLIYSLPIVNRISNVYYSLVGVINRICFVDLISFPCLSGFPFCCFYAAEIKAQYNFLKCEIQVLVLGNWLAEFGLHGM